MKKDLANEDRNNSSYGFVMDENLMDWKTAMVLLVLGSFTAIGFIYSTIQVGKLISYIWSWI